MYVCVCVYDVYGLRSTYSTYEAQTVANQSSTSLEVTTVETLNMEANHHLFWRQYGITTSSQKSYLIHFNDSAWDIHKISWRFFGNSFTLSYKRLFWKRESCLPRHRSVVIPFQVASGTEGYRTTAASLGTEVVRVHDLVEISGMWWIVGDHQNPYPLSIKNYMGPYQRTPKVLGLLDTQV